ncbi:MAG: RNA polymerase factor sigma-54 [Puniceicoccales bacterium]|jgi:RNA polymerase sigma-54 factor|nr:RNA polymerase factor sigma-54 [Puniceicoccales bacterium]
MNTQGLSQSQRQIQGLVLTPQLRQSLRILHISAAELNQEVTSELVANPLLELIPPEDSSASEKTEADTSDNDDPFAENFSSDDAPPDFSEKMEADWRDDYYEEHRIVRQSSEDEEHRQHFFDSAVGEESLQETLLKQARLATSTPGVLAAMQTLIGNLDDRGFMTADPGTLALDARIARADLDTAWTLLKTFDPPGIGAADLRECLLIQLILSGRRHTLAALIVDECFPLLIKRRIPEIARELETSAAEVHNAMHELAQLDFAPARKYAQDDNRFIIPDIIVQRSADSREWDVILNYENIPRLRLNHAYKNLLAGKNLSQFDRDYISGKMRDGRFLISAIEQRQQTLERIAHLLLRYQAEFFEEGISRLHPLTMARIAGDLDVHETTVSRAIANKYIQTPHGIFELRYFFNAGVTTDAGESMANTSIKELLANIVARENPASPLSDEDLADELQKKGIHVARRTIAKYRAALHLPPAFLRKQH